LSEVSVVEGDEEDGGEGATEVIPVKQRSVRQGLTAGQRRGKYLSKLCMLAMMEVIRDRINKLVGLTDRQTDRQTAFIKVNYLALSASDSDSVLDKKRAVAVEQWQQGARSIPLRMRLFHQSG
jgi:hypothetical protein